MTDAGADSEQLDELSAALWQDERYRAVQPVVAVDTWLKPIAER